jgi:hypothetical protein
VGRSQELCGTPKSPGGDVQGQSIIS